MSLSQEILNILTALVNDPPSSLHLDRKQEALSLIMEEIRKAVMT
jgi:hypothetical protein